MFASDMGFVADYLNDGSFEGRSGQRIVHVEALTGDKRFTEQIGELLERQERKGEVRMCEYLDMLEKKGWEKGRMEGHTEGEDSMARLVQFLLAEKKYGEMEEATRDREKRHKLYRRYGIL